MARPPPRPAVSRRHASPASLVRLARTARPARPAAARRILPPTLAPLLFLACFGPSGPAAAPSPAKALVADSSRVDTVAAGVLHRTYFVARGPWVIQTLDVDRRACWAPRLLKAGTEGATGRAPTSSLVADLVAGRAAPRVAGAVNGDFFSFFPDGVPVGPYVADGVVVTGPAMRDVFAVDSAGRFFITRLEAQGTVAGRFDTLRVERWNRRDELRLALFDRHYGARVDSAHSGVALPLRRIPDGRWVPLLAAGPAVVDPKIPSDGLLLVAGTASPEAVRQRLVALSRRGDTVTVRMGLRPFHPKWAIGGFGVLLRNGRIPADLDSTGQASFATARHPRTAIGWNARSGRLTLFVVDGRQPGYSMGMTLRELAETMRALGATEAMNLDGGGSTTLVLPDPAAARGVRIANRPADAEGERPVANGIAIVKECSP